MTSPQPTWISHRGYKENAAENTREAFRAAVDLGFTTLETDLRSTQDNHIVLSHDPDTSRLTGKKLFIHELSRKQLEAVEMKGGRRYLFLDRFLDEFADCMMIFDIKPEQGDRTIRELNNWTAEHMMTEWILSHVKFLAWSAEQEKLIGDLFPGVVFYARENECWRAGLAAIAGLPCLGGMISGKTYAITPKAWGIPVYRKSIVDRFHRKGARVIAYLPETDKDIQDAIDAGVDEILTNGKCFP